MSLELRFDLGGRAAVRVSGGPVGARHVEDLPLSAPWWIEARCGSAVGWLLGSEEPSDVGEARARLEHEVACRTALELQARAAAAGAIGARTLERATHGLRADLASLQLAFGLEGEEVAAAVTETGRLAQRRLTLLRELMGALEPGARAVAEPVAWILREALDAAGRDVAVTEPDERALAWVPGPGWAGCARLLAAAPRVREISIVPDPGGWRVCCGPLGDEALCAGAIVLAAGGLVCADGALVLPAAPANS